MFDENRISQYRSIAAPDSLRQRIAALEKEPAIRPQPKKTGNVRYLRFAGTVAACLAVVIIGTAALGSTRVTVGGERVTHSGVEIGSAPVALAAARAKNEAEVTLTVAARGNTRIRVTGGTAAVVPQDGETAEYATELSVAEPVDIIWSAAAGSASSEMTVTGPLGTKTLVLELDEETNAWTVRLK